MALLVGDAPRCVFQSGGAEGGSFPSVRGGHVLIHGDEVPQEHHAIASRGGGQEWEWEWNGKVLVKSIG